MSLRVSLNLAATELQPNVMSEAQSHPKPDAGHPHAYCLQSVGMNGKMMVANAAIGGPICSKGFQAMGFVSEDSRRKMTATEATAEQMMSGALKVHRADGKALAAILIGVAVVAIANLGAEASGPAAVLPIIVGGLFVLFILGGLTSR